MKIHNTACNHLATTIATNAEATRGNASKRKQTGGTHNEAGKLGAVVRGNKGKKLPPYFLCFHASLPRFFRRQSESASHPIQSPKKEKKTRGSGTSM
jgi:hypothetical protein